MVSVPRDDNFITGILVKGSATGADVVVEGDETTKGMLVQLPAQLLGPGEITVDSYTQVAINLTTGADQVLVSSAASKQIWVYGFGFTVGDADAQSASFQDEDNVALSGIMEFSQYGGMAVAPSGNFAMPIFKVGTNKDLEIDITGGDLDGWLTFGIISV